MADQNTRGDALREYLTGAAFDGGVQTIPSASLGGFRSSTQVKHLGMEIASAIGGVLPLFVSGANGEGTGIIRATDDSTLRWTPPGGGEGPAVTFIAAATKDLEGDAAPGKFIRVLATPPFIPGFMTARLRAVIHNLFGMGKLTAPQLAAGASHYRASMIKNGSAGTVTNFKRWITPLGTQRVSGVAQLGAAGPGSIETASSLADWPASGWCQVRQSGGTLREVVYYDGRTNVGLNVTARGLFGTTPAAGAGTDTVTPVPGVVFGLDPAGVVTALDIQGTPDDETAPAGVTWEFGIDEAGAAVAASIPAGDQFGVWLWRNVPPDAVGAPTASVRFTDKWTVP